MHGIITVHHAIVSEKRHVIVIRDAHRIPLSARQIILIVLSTVTLPTVIMHLVMDAWLHFTIIVMHIERQTAVMTETVQKTILIVLSIIEMRHDVMITHETDAHMMVVFALDEILQTVPVILIHVLEVIL